MNQRLKGKSAVVTGASNGLGAEIARQFAAEGASVVVNYSHSEGAATDLVDDITRAGGTAVAIHADMSNEEQVRQLFVDTQNTAEPHPRTVSAPLRTQHLRLPPAIKEAVHYMTAGASILNMGSSPPSRT